MSQIRQGQPKRQEPRAGLYTEFLGKKVTLFLRNKQDVLKGTILKIDSYDILFQSEGQTCLIPKHAVDLVRLDLGQQTRKLTIPSSNQGMN